MYWSFGYSGWVRFDAPDVMPGPLYVRVADVDGQLRITELYLDGRGMPVTTKALREIPVSHLEAVLLQDEAHIRSRMRHAGPDLTRLASYYRTVFGSQAHHWIADSWLAQIKDSGVPQPPMGREPVSVHYPDDFALNAPEHGLTDHFLRDVARAYDAAVSRRESPATSLAEQAGVSVRTVHGWVFKARKKGLMDPAPRRGRVV